MWYIEEKARQNSKLKSLNSMPGKDPILSNKPHPAHSDTNSICNCQVAADIGNSVHKWTLPCYDIVA